MASRDSVGQEDAQSLAGQLFSSMPRHQGCLSCIQLVAGLGRKASLTCLAPPLECLQWLMASLTPSSCGSPAGFQMVYKGSSAPRVSVSKGPAPVLIKGQPYHLLMSHWSKQVTEPSPESTREGTTQVCKHQGPWLGATNISLHRRLSCCIRTPFNSVLDSRLTNMSGSTARRINVSTWDAMVNAPLAAGLGFHRGKYFLVSIAAFGCHFLRVPWSLIYSDKEGKWRIGEDLNLAFRSSHQFVLLKKSWYLFLPEVIVAYWPGSDSFWLHEMLALSRSCFPWATLLK